MARFVCELCGGDNLVKEGDFFVCQGCGTKYSLEDARKLMQPDAAAAPAPTATPEASAAPSAAAPAEVTIDLNTILSAATAAVAQAVTAAQTQADASYVAQTAENLASTADFNPTAIDVSKQGPLSVNNYAVRAWELFLEEYKAIEHPDAARQEELAQRARECLTLLDNAGLFDHSAHDQDLLIYKNCLELIRSAKDTDYYEEKEEGKFTRRSMPLAIKFEIPAMTDTWEHKRDFHQGFLNQEFLDAHPEIVTRQQELAQRESELNGILDELKDEKRSKGFFNFSAKHEVKERMAPYKEELGQINREQNDYEKQMRDYAENKLRSVCAQYARFYA